MQLSGTPSQIFLVCKRLVLYFSNQLTGNLPNHANPRRLITLDFHVSSMPRLSTTGHLLNLGPEQARIGAAYVLFYHDLSSHKERNKLTRAVCSFSSLPWEQ